MKTKIIAAAILLITYVSVHGQVFPGGVNLANISVTNDGDIDDKNKHRVFSITLGLKL